ncbi:hypothetical protein HDU81_006689 [Chytriomyces hyalinus]|nr:hypothetical protein HDU81_006689 [Chytriomyces hyalinus]
MSQRQNDQPGAASYALSDEDETEHRNDDQTEEEHSNGPGDERGATDTIQHATPVYGIAQDQAATPTETGPPSRAASVTGSGMTRNTYTIDMKIKVAERGLEKGRNIAAKEYGLNGSMVGRWMRSIDTMRQTILASEEAAEPFGSASSTLVQTKRRRLPDGITMVTGGRKDSSTAQAKLKRRNTNDQGDVKEETVSTSGSTPQQSISHEFPAQQEVSTTSNVDLKGKARLLGVQPVTLSDHQTRQYASQQMSSLPTSLPMTSHAAEGSVPDPLMMNLYFSNSNPMNSPINYQGVFHLPPQQAQQQLQYSTSIQPHNTQSIPNQHQQQQTQQQKPSQPPTPSSSQQQQQQQQQQTSLQTDFFMQQQPLSLNSTSSSHFLSTHAQGTAGSESVTPFHAQPQLNTSQPFSVTLHNTEPISGANTASKMGVSIALAGLKNALDVYNDDTSLDDAHWKELVPLLKDTVKKCWPLYQNSSDGGGQPS